MYKKKSYGRRKRTFKKRRSFKKRSFKAKRIGNKMMGRGAKVVKFKQASLIRLFNPTGTPIPNPGFTLAFLNNPNAANLIQTIKPNGVGASYTQW